MSPLEEESPAVLAHNLYSLPLPSLHQQEKNNLDVIESVPELDDEEESKKDQKIKKQSLQEGEEEAQPQIPIE